MRLALAALGVLAFFIGWLIAEEYADHQRRNAPPPASSYERR